MFAGGGPDNFTDVQATVGIDPDVVWRQEIAGGSGVLAAAPAGLQFTGQVENADTAAHWVRAGFLPWEESHFAADIRHEYVVLGIDEYLHGPGGVRPFRDEFTVGLEDLDAAVFAISHVDASVAVDCNAMRQIELARSLTRLTPGE